MNFYPEAMDIDKTKLQVVLAGEIKLQVAQGGTISQPSRYLVQYKLSHGRLWVVGFERIGEADAA